MGEKKSFALPLDDASDDWMIDDDIGTMIEDEEEEVEKEKEPSSKEAKVEVTEDKEAKVEVTDKKSFSLPLDDASDDWMLDENLGGMVEEEEDKVVPQDKEVTSSSSSSCKRSDVENSRKEPEVEKKSFSLPLDDASDDWMLD